ncbi:alpha-amylase family glycosyl hydrolase [Salinicoccus jeotgali]|uniref:Alpha-amylase family glycosyl hydrolase n=1 Tax=Salinicoccus jeotgali TaxID=381634 RepID=A0ABP7F6T3_9STAP
MKKTMIYMAMLLMAFGLTYDTASAETTNTRIYTIVVDRFMSGDDGNDINVTDEKETPLPFGGDFQGIESNLDYIKDMGFSALMLSPVFDRAEDDYLGYAVREYGEIEEALGGPEAFKSLIDAAHERGMDVIVDMPATLAEGYTAFDAPVLNDIQQDYYGMIDAEFIDLQNADNQKRYKEMAREFTEDYNIDGLSMTVIQDGIDAKEFLPEDVTTYGISGDDDITLEGFDHAASNDLQEALSYGFSKPDREIPAYPTDGTLLLADHWFSERFTHNVVEANMFPGTRINQLTTYLYAYQGPIAFQYGTEIALNGDEIPIVHRQMDLWTDQELVDEIEAINEVTQKHPQIYQGETEVIKNEDGHFVQRYYTSDVDFVLNINSTSATENVKVPFEGEDESKMLSGMLIGDLIRGSDMKNEAFLAVLDREESELYAIIEETGMNNGYIYAGLLIFGGFGIFVWLVARRRRPKERK